MLGAAWMVAKRGDRRPVVAIGWVVLAYLAASNILIPTGQLLAERTLFCASVGVAMLAAWALAQTERASLTEQRAAVSVAAALTILGTYGTIVRVPVWSSEERLFRSGIEFDPAAFYPYQMLARAAGRHGDNARGLVLLGEAYGRIQPGRVSHSSTRSICAPASMATARSPCFVPRRSRIPHRRRCDSRISMRCSSAADPIR